MRMPLHTTTFSGSIFAQRSIDAVFAELENPARIVGLQPLLVHHEVLQSQVSPDGNRSDYDIFYIERFKIIGKFGYNNKINVHMSVLRNEKRIHFEVHSAPRVTLKSEYQLLSAGDGTRINQSVALECPKILAGFIVGQAKAAHARLLINLKQRLESSQK